MQFIERTRYVEIQYTRNFKYLRSLHFLEFSFSFVSVNIWLTLFNRVWNVHIGWVFISVLLWYRYSFNSLGLWNMLYQTKKDINTNYDCNTYLWVCPVGVRSLLDNLKQTSIRYTTIEIKESSHIGYTGFLFLHSYLGHWLSAEYVCGKRNPLYPTRATSFVSIVMYLTCTIFMLWIKF